MNAKRFIVASTGLLVMFGVASLFAATSRAGAVHRTVRAHQRKLAWGAALVVAVGVAWVALSPLAAAGVPLLFAAGAAAISPCEPDDLTDYVSASYDTHSDEPPWWPEFERQFRRECRRLERVRRRPRLTEISTPPRPTTPGLARHAERAAFQVPSPEAEPPTRQ